MSLATNMRATADRLLTANGEDALFKAVTLTDVPTTGNTVEAGSNVAIKAYRYPVKKSYTRDGSDAAIRQFASGALQIKAEEAAFIPAADLSAAPKPGDLLTWGTSDVAANRRRVVEVEAINVAGTDVLYIVGVEK